LIQLVLEEAGHEVRCVGDGVAGLLAPAWTMHPFFGSRI
jgi:hypothetical protein